MRAVVFTHFPTSYQRGDRFTNKRALELKDQALECIRRYLACRNVGLVYVYVDVGMRVTLEHLQEETGHLAYSSEELVFVESIHNCLKWALDLATREFKNRPGSWSGEPIPEFQFVGIRHLMALLELLEGIDPSLVKDLGGPDCQLTYDSPKFAEAVIRLARSAHQDSAEHPVIRLDADVHVNSDAVGELLGEIERATRTEPYGYHFFSGGYGTRGGPPDPLNDFAVRTHWLCNLENQTIRGEYRQFLRDLGEFGATQLPTAVPMSKRVAGYVRETRHGTVANRDVQQVISGAGLYMSQRAIHTLPPFMNLAELTLWVDDHLKRRLHEALGHIHWGAVEHVGALFAQDRHPQGVQPRNMDWAQEYYFDRVLRGCLLHVLIEDPPQEPGILSRCVEKVLEEPRAFELDDQLKKEIVDVARGRAEDLLKLWVREGYGSSLLRGWARSRLPQCDQIAAKTALDALAYLRLVETWPKYVTTIERLEPHHAYWLFRDVKD